MASYWKFADARTVEMIATHAKFGKVTGLFLQGEENPVAWILLYSQGSIGMLHTRKEFRRRGFGAFLVQNLVKRTSEQGLIPYVHIEDDNEMSKNMFLKLGFAKSIK